MIVELGDVEDCEWLTRVHVVIADLAPLLSESLSSLLIKMLDGD